MKNRFGLLIGLGIGLLVILIVVALFFGAYNSLITKSQTVDAQWAQVQTQYQRRFDLIPNLVNTVKGIMKQELAVYGEITDARTKYAGAPTINDRAAAAGQVEVALSKLLAIVESNPQLVSQTSVTQLMDELAGTENRISVERKRYNDAVRDYNTSIKKLPMNFIASMFNFGPREYFESVSGADQPPTVEF